jgi:GTP diphosphokinase / guanosine-3',5'-bis(diphosphate) 3'-diphosphatase
MAEDIRVVLIKLADRLHNMRTLGACRGQAAADRPPDDGDLRAARGAARHLADQVGARGPRRSRSSSRSAYRELAKLLDTRRKGARRTSTGRSPCCGRASRRPGSRPTSRAGPKHIYSIWKKMQRKGAEFGEIYDVYAIRVLVDEVRDCYAALGRRPRALAPIPGQFDDYIAVPKNNLYQSLHTAVIALDGKPLEIQIRTHADAPGQRGRHRRPLALQGGDEVRPRVRREARLAAPAHGLAARRHDATEFVEGIKLDIFQDQVFVFTPRATSRTCRPARRRSTSPTGSTPTSATGRSGRRSTTGSCPLDYRLKNGDIVEIVTTKGEHGPSRDWLNVVRTSHAREKIRQWFKRKDRDENIVHGRESLERELRRLARTSISAVGLDRIAEVAKHLRNHETVDDFFAAIGYGAIVRPSRSSCASASSTTAKLTLPPVAPPAGHADRRGPGQGRRRPPRPLRQVLPPDPGRPDRRLHHPRQGRDRPPAELPDGDQRARGQPADRGRVGGRAAADLPDRHPGRGLRPDRPAQRHHPGRRREQGEHRRRERRSEPGPHGDRHRDAPGPVRQRSSPG